MTSPRELRVRVNDQTVGTLRTQDDIWRFAYAEAWLQSPQAFALAPNLPLATQEYVDGSDLRFIQWYFDNLLPEENLRTVLAKEARIDQTDAFGLLAYFGAESAGSLVLEAPTSMPAATGWHGLALRALNERILNLPRTTLTHDSPKRMSLAGAQHKMVVGYENGELFEPLAGTASTHILKPNSQSENYPHSVINEYFTMRLAAAVNLSVPKVYRLYAPEPAYIVARFDRVEMPSDGEVQRVGYGEAKPNGDVQRLHIIDTCQLLGKSRAFKYEQAKLDTLAAAANLCTHRVVARLQLYRWVLFNYFVGNADNHLKNISFLISHEGIHISPAYDLLSTAVYDTKAMAENPIWPATPLALPLDQAMHFHQVTRSMLLESGRTLGLASSTVERELDAMVTALPGQADKLLAEIEGGYSALIAASPDPVQASWHQAGEMRLLRTIRHLILTDTLAAVKQN